MEKWKDIPKYEGDYEASSYGRIKNSKTNKVMNPALNPYGYLQVGLYMNKKPKTFIVHKLIAICFHAHIPDGMNSVIDHIDGDKLNNYVNNLQVTTTRVNSSKDQHKHNRISKYVGVSKRNDRKKCWCATIYINGKIKQLGYYYKEIEAHKVYQNELNNLNLQIT